MHGEEVVDEGCAVVASNRAESGHSCEHERSDELADREFAVDAAEFGASFRVGEDGVEGLSVLVDNSGPQSPGCVGIVSVVFGAGRPE
ncbi:Uncharacterised protein [Mycobacteroides abscessus subsp. abscessus]|nr:Uncharacterised protein [Mycobacteroides abscessus subsp. abscessus]SLJ67787.1 Uncharacterised protein [Mycobacteroides abscessus subsp. abscessus]